MDPFRTTIDGLAEALVAGAWRPRCVLARGHRALGGRPRWLGPVVDRLVARSSTAPAVDAVVELLRSDAGFAARRPFAVHVAAGRPRMAPTPGPPSSWAVPPLVTLGELADWLGLGIADLDWFADPVGRSHAAPPGPLRHYRCWWRAKRTGSSRLIEAPKPRLKAIQRRLLDGILAAIPPHPAAHGFRPGRSPLTFAALHAGRAIVARVDLAEFFPTIGRGRVAAIFRTAGYPEAVAHALAGLCTHRAPPDAWRLPDAPPVASPEYRPSRLLYGGWHLPQGSPTSPSLANLIAHRLDARLDGLARSAGGVYARYADDLAFSGDEAFARVIGRVLTHARAIIREEGFAVHPGKTRIMRQAGRQRLVGAIVNDRPNIPRADFDRLKAILHHRARDGGADGAERAHLAGRIAYVATLNPARAAKLRALFDRIAWVG